MSATIQNDDSDKLIKLVQSCTHDLMCSFREKTELLTKCSDDLRLLIREGYNAKIAKETAEKFFGKKRISFMKKSEENIKAGEKSIANKSVK